MKKRIFVFGTLIALQVVIATEIKWNDREPNSAVVCGIIVCRVTLLGQEVQVS
jgi:hypothetical protein